MKRRTAYRGGETLDLPAKRGRAGGDQGNQGCFLVKDGRGDEEERQEERWRRAGEGESNVGMDREGETASVVGW